ncbi:MAG TPA: SoxR reducing system RseC family protein [bacterium]|nr:SoxR reducing system RseC family protein [bacterium]HPP11151.1 SoxR reducing system RseC family protein [bacterium]
MQERGIVIEAKDHLATVKLDRMKTAGCARCGLCQSAGDGRLFLEVENPAGARKGDQVTVEILAQAAFLSSLFVYGIPLAGFICGVIVSGLVTITWLRAIIFLTLLGSTWWAGLVLGERYGRQHRPKIIQVIIATQDRSSLPEQPLSE